jgi:hypothetical protein
MPKSIATVFVVCGPNHKSELRLLVALFLDKLHATVILFILLRPAHERRSRNTSHCLIIRARHAR